MTWWRKEEGASAPPLQTPTLPGGLGPSWTFGRPTSTPAVGRRIRRGRLSVVLSTPSRRARLLETVGKNADFAVIEESNEPECNDGQDNDNAGTLDLAKRLAGV